MSMSVSMSGKASDPGSAWFGGGSRSPAPGPAHNVRLIAASVAVFVSVLGIALLLHLYICHARRRNRRRAAAAAAAALQAEASKAPKTGLDPSAIAALPTAAYDEEAAGGEPGQCAICLGAARQGDAVRVLPSCAHVFHVACVDTWLASSSSCPVCRALVEPPPPPPSSSSAAAAGSSVQGKQSLEKEDVGTSGTPCSGLGASLMKMLSRERPAARRPVHGDQVDMRLEDLESQLPQQLHTVNTTTSSN